MLSACASAPGAGGPPARPPTLATADAASALRLQGELRGPLLGIGQSVQLTAWVRADGWVRADLRYAVDGRTAEDVLVWTPDAAFLVDRRSGRLTLLGDQPGTVEADGAAFRVEHALWLVLGRDSRSPAGGDLWGLRRGEWRAGMGPFAARGRPQRRDQDLAWTELAWRTPAGQIRSLTATLRRPADTPWGRVPREISLEGSRIPGRAVVSWQVQSVPAPGDSLFDPLWRP